MNDNPLVAATPSPTVPVPIMSAPIAQNLTPPTEAPDLTNGVPSVNPLAAQTPAAAPAQPAMPAVAPVTPFGQKLHAALLRSLPALALKTLGASGNALTSILAPVAAPETSPLAYAAKTAQNIQNQKIAKAEAEQKQKQQDWSNMQESQKNDALNQLHMAQAAVAMHGLAAANDSEQQKAADRLKKQTDDLIAQGWAPLDDQLRTLDDVNAKIKDGSFDTTKGHAMVDGFIAVPNGDGTVHTVPGYKWMPLEGPDVPVTDDMRSELSKVGIDLPKDLDTLSSVMRNKVFAEMNARASTLAMVDSVKDKELVGMLKLEGDQNKAQYGLDLQNVNPYLAVHAAKYGGDMIAALSHLQGATDPTTGKPTEAALSAARLLSGPNDPNDPKVHMDWMKQLETYRHNRMTEAAAFQKNAIEAANKKTDKGEPAGDTGKTGVEYLASLPAPERALIQQLHDGNFVLQRWDYPIARGSAIAQELALAYPNDKFDSSKAASYSKTYQDFTSGKTSQQLKSGSNAIQHLEQLYDLDTISSRLGLGNNVTADSAEFQTTLNTVVPEQLKFYGETPTNENVKQMRDALTPNFNRRDAIAQQIDLMTKAYGSLHQQWTNAAPSKVYEQPMPGVNPEVKKVLTRFEPDFVAEYPQFQYKPQAANPNPPNSNPTPTDHIVSNAPKGTAGIAPALDGSGKLYYVDAQGRVLAPVPPQQ
jgi:hypothetical protein